MGKRAQFKHPIVSQLRDVRLRRGKLQKQVAFDMGCDPERMRKYERGKFRPSVQTLLNWCAALGCELVVRDLS